MINTTELHKVLRFKKDTMQALMSLIVVASSFCICMPNRASYITINFDVTKLICIHSLIAKNSLILAVFHQFITLFCICMPNCASYITI